MKIKRISCEQFAGIRDMDVSFGDGINVVYGKNESGKSTLVNLLSRTLFQKVRLDGRSDREFIGTYFPSVAKGKTKLESIDGKVRLEAADGTYTLAKEWGEDARVSLSTPDGSIRDQDRVDERLKELLGYGEGVYADMLFSSQRNTDVSLGDILDAAKKTDAKQELAEVLTKAFMESDGISPDAIGEAIGKKIDELGAHWDAAAHLPVKKSGGGRYQKGLGEVLAAYYDLEDKNAVIDRIKEYERAADSALYLCKSKGDAVGKAEEAYERFDKYATRLARRDSLEMNLRSLEGEIGKDAAALENWPLCSEQLRRAQALLLEKQNREALEKYARAKQVYDGLNALKAAHAGQACPSEREIGDAKSALRRIGEAENRLCGMNLAAAVRMYGGNRMEITSVRTGEQIDFADGKAILSEAVDLTIPGVMELRLAPADVDVAAAEALLREQRAVLEPIFAKYSVDGIEALEALEKQYLKDEAEIKVSEAQLNAVLGGDPFGELELRAASVPAETRGEREIAAEISSLCGGDLSAFIAEKNAAVNGYIGAYGDMAALKGKLGRATADCEAVRRELAQTEVPPEYLGIDPERYKQSLKSGLEQCRREKESALEAWTRAQTELERYRADHGDPAEEKEAAERRFEELSAALSHWLHIREVFEQQRAGMQNSPMHDLAECFSKYLGIISEGKVSSEFPSEEKLDVNVFSDSRPLDFGKLSEGTKETVSLAFRLAVLDHLFPKGGGVIVLDDPLVNMDADRTAQAVKLLTECATRHQVIFLTCKEEYAGMLNGTQITL